MWKKILSVACIMLIALVTIAGCSSDSPEKTFCKDMDNLETALNELSALTTQSTKADLDNATNKVDDAFNDLVNSAKDVSRARVDDLRTAYDNLNNTINNIPGEATISQSLELLVQPVQAVIAAWTQLYAEVDCSNVE